MTNVIQFPTATTINELNNLKIDPNKPSAIVQTSKRTLNDVSPAEWDAVARSIMDRQAIHTK